MKRKTLKFKDKLEKASFEHVMKLYSVLNNIELKNDNRFFSIDKGFLIGGYTNIIKRSSLKHWMIKSSEIINKLSTTYQRIVPIENKKYSDFEQDQIKFTIHSLLSLGSIVHIPFTHNSNFLENNFHTNNLLQINNILSIDSNSVYDIDEELFINVLKPDKFDLFTKYLDSNWKKTNNIYTLAPSINYFNTGVKERKSLKGKYGEFLYNLQNGKCRVSGDNIEFSKMQLDHIFPTSKGGTNALINLQLIDETINLSKSDKTSKEQERIFNDLQLIEIGLDCHYPYPELTYRNLTFNPFQMTIT